MQDPARPRQLTPPEVFDEIQRIIGQNGVGYPKHLRERSYERSFDAEDILRVLQAGTISPRAEWSEKFKNWKYRITGCDYDNAPLIVVVALQPAIDRLTVVTAYGD